MGRSVPYSGRCGRIRVRRADGGGGFESKTPAGGTGPTRLVSSLAWKKVFGFSAARKTLRTIKSEMPANLHPIYLPRAERAIAALEEMEQGFFLANRAGEEKVRLPNDNRGKEELVTRSQAVTDWLLLYGNSLHGFASPSGSTRRPHSRRCGGPRLATVTCPRCQAGGIGPVQVQQSNRAATGGRGRGAAVSSIEGLAPSALRNHEYRLSTHGSRRNQPPAARPYPGGWPARDESFISSANCACQMVSTTLPDTWPSSRRRSAS